MARPVVLDKSYLQGTCAEQVEQLCNNCRTLIPDVHLYELFLAPSSTRARCLRKLRRDQPVVDVVMGLGVLFRFEVNNCAPCTPLDERFVVRVKLADSLFDSSGTLTPEQTQYLDKTEMDLCAQTVNVISIWRTVDRFFPRLHGLKPGDSCEAVEQARNSIANDTLTVRQIYEDIRQQWEIPNWFHAELPPPHLIGPQWVIYRWLQLNLLAAIDILKEIPLGRCPERTEAN